MHNLSELLIGFLFVVLLVMLVTLFSFAASAQGVPDPASGEIKKALTF